MAEVLILPGIGNSGPEHWQSRWQARDATLRRVQVPDWDAPVLSDWVAALDAAVAASREVPVIVAHSLGCLAVAHWVAAGGRARAALLVAVPDPACVCFPAVAQSFGPTPVTPIPFPSRVVASQDDPYGSFAFATRCADAWQSTLVDAGHIGHINAQSGLGDWPAGRALLDDFLS